MRRVDFARYENETYGAIHAITYEKEDPFIGEVWDVSGTEVSCNKAEVVEMYFQRCVGRLDAYPGEDLSDEDFWFMVMRPHVEQPCDEDFMEEISS